MTTPAPSLEHLPPQRGSILELHSIGNEEFDGLLVEFERIDKASGGTKIFVTALDDESRGMRVKAKCCRRPEIKPLELRVLLAKLVEEIAESTSRYNPNYDEADAPKYRTTLESFLANDPCCAPALGLLGTLLLREESVQEKAIRFLRRDIANAFAYEEIMENGYANRQQNYLSRILIKTGRLNSACRLNKKSHNAHEGVQIKYQIENEALLGTSMVDRAKMMTNQPMSAKSHKLLKAANYFFKALKIAADDERYLDVNFCKEDGSFLAAYSGVGELLALFLRHHQTLTEEDDEKAANINCIIRLAEGMLNACTAKNGNIVLMTEHQIELWTTLSSTDPATCLEYIEDVLLPNFFARN